MQTISRNTSTRRESGYPRPFGQGSSVVEPKAAVMRETVGGTYSITFRRGTGALRVVHLDTLLSSLKALEDFASMGYRTLDLTQ